LGDGREHDADPAWDAAEAAALYDLLEHEVIPEFYTRDEQGIPTGWVARMRASMATLTPKFSVHRAVRDYTEQHYLPAASAYLERSANNGAVGSELVAARHTLAREWNLLRFGEAKVATDGEQHVFDVQVYLDDIDPDLVRVELYAEAVGEGTSTRQEMRRERPLVGATNGYVFSARVPATRPATDYTPRLTPRYAGVAVPLEDSHILWQR
jgi:starch phosphorylase